MWLGIVLYTSILLVNTFCQNSIEPTHVRCPETCNATAKPCDCYIDGWVDCVQKNIKFISTIPTCARSLIIKKNQITRLELQDFQRLTQLQNLEIQFEKITEIFPGTFADLSNLTMLDLSSNQITVIHECAFEGLFSLQTLILSDNKIIFIDETAFDGLVNINSISLFNNSLKNLKIQWFQNKPNISTVLVAKNNWNCTCALKQDSMYVINSLTHLRVHCSPIPNFYHFNNMCIKCQYPKALEGKVLNDIPYLNFTNCTTVEATSASSMVTTAFIEKLPPFPSKLQNDESYCKAKLIEMKNALQSTTTSNHTSTVIVTKTYTETYTTEPQLSLPVWGISLIVAVVLIIITAIVLLALMCRRNYNNSAMSNHLTAEETDIRSSNYLNKSYEASHEETL